MAGNPAGHLITMSVEACVDAITNPFETGTPIEFWKLLSTLTGLMHRSATGKAARRQAKRQAAKAARRQARRDRRTAQHPSKPSTHRLVGKFVPGFAA